jgi:hypothetical protein
MSVVTFVATINFICQNKNEIKKTRKASSSEWQLSQIDGFFAYFAHIMYL